MEELGLPELTDEQIEKLCVIAEEAARRYIYSRVPQKKVEALNLAAEVEGAKPVNLIMEIDVSIPPSLEIDAKKLVDESLKAAFRAAEEYLRGLTCRSQE